MIENIKIAIETVNENRWGTKFALWENVREHAKKNALLFMTANKMPDADAVALLARVSTRIMKVAPRLTDAGSRDRWLLPNFIRHIWGISRPTQPTCPHMDTQEAVMAVAHTTVMPRRTDILTPEALASSSLRGSRFSRQRSRKSTAMPSTTGGVPKARVS